MDSCEDLKDHIDDSDRLLDTESDDEQTLAVPEHLPSGRITSLVYLKKLSSKLKRRWFVQELIALVRLAIPVMFSLIFEYSLLIVSLLFISHIPNSKHSTNYAAAGLAASFVNVTGISVGNGLATASDTLSSQAFGYKNYKRVGVILQRGILILGVFVLPICAMWLNTESILLLVQQEPCVASLSSLYVRLSCVALPFMFLYILLQHYLQAQGIVWQFVLFGFLVNCISVVLHVVFIYGFKLGFKGAVIAAVIADVLLPFTVIGYIWIRKLHKQTWGGWSWESLKQWGQYLKLAVPGLLMTCFEWWSAEITTFVAGSIDEIELAVNSVWFQTMVILYMVPIGMGVAISVRVGNELGAGNPTRAKLASYIAVAIILCVAVLYTILLMSVKDVIGYLFVPGNDVVAHKVSNLMYVACFFLYSDFVQVVIAGALRGSGRQYIGAIMNVISYYIIGLPLGITLALKANLGALGLWIGMAGGNVVHSVTFIVVLLRTNWQKESEKAMKAAQGESDPTNSTPSSSNQEDKTEEDDSPTVSESNSMSSVEQLLTDKEGDGDSVPLKNLAGEVATEETTADSGEHQGEEDVTCNPADDKRRCWRRREKLVLLRSSFFLVGLIILVTGGVCSRFLRPYVDPEEYLNCSLVDTSQWIGSGLSSTHTTPVTTLL